MIEPTRLLHEPARRPYYIEAPSYRRTSAGIRVMHLLCHLLNRSGYDAYLYPVEATNPMWHTPVLTPQLWDAHRAAGRRPITVYPEVVSGNPRHSRAVVRYLLNRPGLIGGETQYANTDLIFAYTRQLLPPGEDPAHVMFMPANDTSVFNNRDNPDDGRRKGWLLYPGRHAKALQEHAALASQCTLITGQWPATWQELAELFRRSERLYCFESTSVALEAVLCGCPAIVLPSPYFNGTLLGVEELGTHGFALADTPQALAEAVAGLPLAWEKFAQVQDRFWEQFEVFVRDTQAMPDAPETATGAVAQAPEQTPDQGGLAIRHWLAQRQPGAAAARLIARRLTAQAALAPHFDIVVLPGTDPSASQATVHSLRQQAYAHARVTIAPDADAATLNALAEQSQAQWLCFVEAGTAFTPSGLTQLALELMDTPGCRAVCADEITTGADGRLATLLRPDFNLDMFLSWPAGMARHWFYRRDVFLGAGGFDAVDADAREFGLLLRLIESEGLAGLGHVHEPLWISRTPPLADNARERAALERHLHARGYAQAVVDAASPGCYRVLYGHARQPLVSIVLAVTQAPGLAERSLRSVLEVTGYSHFEILLAAGTGPGNETDARIGAWLDEVQARGDARIRILRLPQPLGCAALRNQAAAAAQGECLVLLGEGCTVLQEGWIDALLNHALRPEVGVVGAKLLDARGKIASAGMVLGLNGPAASAFVGADPDAAGDMQRLQIDQNCSAVSGDAMMVRRALYEQVQGLDEQALADAWGDVDLCLKVTKTGHLVVWTPHVVLRAADEPHAAPANEAAQDAMYRRWLPEMANDPACNRNQSLLGAGFELETTVDLNWNPLPWRPLPVALALALAADMQDEGCYRITHPAIALSAAGRMDVRLSQRQYLPAEMQRLQPDAWILQNQVSESQIAALRQQARFTQAFKVAEVSSYLPGLPEGHTLRRHAQADALDALRRMAAQVDRLVVPSDAMAEALRPLHPDVRVLPTCLPPLWWDALSNQRRVGARARVGWAGGMAERGDLMQIAEVMRALAGEVHWVILGSCPAPLQTLLHEMHESVAIEQFPAKLAGLNLDLALAPLEPHRFNECKSDLQVLQYGACGYPVVCSDLPPFHGALPLTRVPNETRAWVDAIRAHVGDLDASARLGDQLREVVLAERMLEGAHLASWEAAWLPG